MLAAALDKASDEATAAGSAEIKATTSGPQTGGKPVVVAGLYSWGNGLKGRTWLKMDASALMGADGAAALKNGSSNDPTAGLKLLKYAKGVSKVGKEDVNGKAATHYHAKISLAELGDAAAIYESMGTGATDLVADVWIDDKGMPARMTNALGAVNVSMDFLSFGGRRRSPRRRPKRRPT